MTDFVFLSIFSLAALFSSLFYIYIIWRYITEWDKIDPFQIPANYHPNTVVSVVIPARNEGKNIENCLNSILKQTYPENLVEIIVVDDHSEDETLQVLEKIEDKRIKVFQSADFKKKKKAQAFKKNAIEIGIAQSKGKLIVTTDADCQVPPNWLSTIVAFYEAKGSKFIAAPVNFCNEKNLFQKFQSLDFLGMMGVTGGGIAGKFMNMCNGANLAYEKEAFEAVNGFEGIDQIASGDDMLLMQKMAKQFPGKIHFLKSLEVVVKTEAQPNLKSFVNQRIRWASKTSSYKEWRVTFILSMVFLLCFSIVLSFILIPFRGLEMLLIFGFLFSIKTVMDYFFLGKMANYFKKKDLMKSFLAAQFLHILYIVLIGIFSVFVKKYDWKGRKVR